MPDLATSDHYEELSLWTHIAGLNHALFARMETVEEDAVSAAKGANGEGAGAKEDATAWGDIVTKPSAGDRTAAQKYRDAFMAQVTTDYSNDFDKLRQDPSFSGNKIGLLVDCLESGIDIFAPPANLENAD